MLLPIGILVALGGTYWFLEMYKDGPKVGKDDSGFLTGSKRWSVADVVRTSQPYNNDIPAKYLANAVRAASLLDAIDAIVGIDRTTSWYRSEAVNTAVGGVKGSAHRTGRAVDIDVSIPRTKAMGIIYQARETLDIDKCILYEPAGGKPELHVQTPLAGKGNKPRRIFLFKPANGDYRAWKP